MAPRGPNTRNDRRPRRPTRRRRRGPPPGYAGSARRFGPQRVVGVRRWWRVVVSARRVESAARARSSSSCWSCSSRRSAVAVPSAAPIPTPRRLEARRLAGALWGARVVAQPPNLGVGQSGRSLVAGFTPTLLANRRPRHVARLPGWPGLRARASPVRLVARLQITPDDVVSIGAARYGYRRHSRGSSPRREPSPVPAQCRARPTERHLAPGRLPRLLRVLAGTD